MYSAVPQPTPLPTESCLSRRGTLVDFLAVVHLASVFFFMEERKIVLQKTELKAMDSYNRRR